MAIIRYQLEELLQLRDSPLVARPDSLPPIEEWMGPIPDPTTQRKSTRDQPTQPETNHQRRSSLFEARHISRASGSENLVLGPPKTSFASATRNSGKTVETTDKSLPKTNDQDDPKQDRYGGLREKFFKEREYGDKDRDFDRRDTRALQANGRRITREDREDWNGRQRRNFGQDEDRDRRLRRSGDIERWDGRESRDQQDGNERSNRDQGRFSGRRDTQGRTRHDQPWHRDGETQDTVDAEEEKTPIRNREWRRGLHGQDRDWGRSVKQEQDPEWMDSTSRTDTKEAHTQEDFQRWKERMKAGAGQTPTDVKKESGPEPPNEEPKKSEMRREGEIFSDFEPSFRAETGLDNFFDFWGTAKSGQDAVVGDIDARKETAPKPAKASRFAGFFHTQAEPKEAEISQVNIPRPSSTDADQEGFQRILQMLGGNKSRNATPRVEEPSQPQPQTVSLLQTALERGSNPPKSAAQENFERLEYMNAQEQVPRDRAPPGPDNTAPIKISKDNNAPRNGTDLLLQLMQQSKIAAQVPAGQNHHPLQRPGSQNLPETVARNHGIQSHKVPGYAEDPTLSNFRRPDVNDPRSQLRRRPTGGPVGFFEEMHSYPGASGGSHTVGNPPDIRQGPPQHSMGMHRPPGLDQMLPPGWPHQPIQQGNSINPVMFPPGLPTPQARNMNQSYASAPPMPLPAGIPAPADRPPFQRGVSANASAGFAPPPPGILPPPGYLHMNAPPPPPPPGPGFPPLQHSNEAMMGMSHGHPGHYGSGPHQAPPQSAKQLLDMFMHFTGNPGDGQVGPRNNAGMMGPAGHYR
ncbi:hypothetical protein LOZ53_001874 [Ophidiomyces ophidiicola]|nr:hypothetical protein LOZ55_004360 [Ophidiomyces ophidiicola]KAI1985233.1 hypothetical protein LOZ51_006475 [Ophidiomyces ophidiicola]KAI1994147.1 hypothetical protein LOZ53_001874 [Ophidiomyces ophidiicola]